MCCRAVGRNSTARFRDDCFCQRTSWDVWGRADLSCFADCPFIARQAIAEQSVDGGRFFSHLAVESDPDKASDRAKRDAELCPEMKRVWEENLSVYGACKLWPAPLGSILRMRLPGNE